MNINFSKISDIFSKINHFLFNAFFYFTVLAGIIYALIIILESFYLAPIFLILFLFVFVIIGSILRESKRFEAIVNKVILTFGSFFILFAVIDSYFGKFNLVGESSLYVTEKIEMIGNYFVVFLILAIIYLCFAFWFFILLCKIVKNEDIRGLLLFILFFFPFFCVSSAIKDGPDIVSPIISFIYKYTAGIIGFSILFVQISYWSRELLKLKKPNQE